MSQQQKFRLTPSIIHIIFSAVYIVSATLFYLYHTPAWQVWRGTTIQHDQLTVQQHALEEIAAKTRATMPFLLHDMGAIAITMFVFVMSTGAMVRLIEIKLKKRTSGEALDQHAIGVEIESLRDNINRRPGIREK
jgi:hypothetical protein